VDYNSILDVTFIGIYPILTTGIIRMSKGEVLAGLGRSILCSLWFEELLE